MTEVYLLKIPRVSEQEFGRLLELVSDERRAKIQRLRVKEKQSQSLFAALLARAVLCLKTDASNDELRFSKTEQGKPFLQAPVGVYFNLSHCEHFVAVAVSNGEVGVDIETFRPLKHSQYARFLSPAEYEYIEAEPTLKEHRFFEVWTKKEAYFKRSGDGLTAKARFFDALRERCVKTAVVDNVTVSVACVDGEFGLFNGKISEKILREFIG